MREGNDVRNDIYLPDQEEVWIDYLNREKYPADRYSIILQRRSGNFRYL